MKLKVLNILASLFITACAITSCLDEGNMDYVLSSNAAIKKFGIKYEGPCSITTVRQNKRYLVTYNNGQITVEQYVNNGKVG